MTASGDTTPKKKGSAWPLYAILLSLPAMVILVFVLSGNIEAAAGEYLSHVRAGKLDEAYAMLAPRTQARVPRAAFETSLFTAELGGAGEPWWNHTEGGDGRACADGSVSVDGETMSLRVYLRDEGDGYRVEEVFLFTGRAPEGPWRCNTP